MIKINNNIFFNQLFLIFIFSYSPIIILAYLLKNLLKIIIIEKQKKIDSIKSAANENHYTQLIGD